MKIIRIHFITLFVLLTTYCFGQTKTTYPQNYFRNPLDIPISLAGSFGEIRPNHFHSGIDIKTNSVEGLNVYAVADGYVSRIRVSANGFGNALYITHPNGYVSVYGHLKKYNVNIAQYLKSSQYAQESFEVDLFPLPNELPVKKSDIVAFSGNTGSSGGPHLHFELRDVKTENTINPQLFGYDIPDDVPPVILSIKMYPMNNKGTVNEQNLATTLVVRGKSGQYSLINPSPINVHGKIGFGIATYDSQTSAMEKNGVYSIEIKLDKKRFYYYELDKFSFAETRGVNSHIDYLEKMKSNKTIQKCCVAPNNPLSIYKELVNNGTINFLDNQIHEIEYIVRDAKGNTSTLIFNVQSSSAAPTILNTCKNPECQAVFHFGKNNIYKTSDLLVEIPGSSLYDSLFFEYSKTPSTRGLYSPVHHIHNIYTPVNIYDISIKPENLPDQLKSKALIVLVSEGGTKSSQGGAFQNGYVSTKVKYFGNYAVAVDTTAPTIVPKNISPNKNMSKSSTIQFKISDNLSGIKSYRATVDGRWILMELEGKTSLLTYKFDDHVPKGIHELILKVIDLKNNSKEFKCTFTR